MIDDLSKENFRAWIGGLIIGGLQAYPAIEGEAKAWTKREASPFVANPQAADGGVSGRRPGGNLELGAQVDGIWCSFTAAFFPDLLRKIYRWAKHLKPDGWLVVTEVDDLFGYEPLAAETKALLNAYAEEALTVGRYDFRMGRKLERYLLQAGFLVSKTFTLADQELALNRRCWKPGATGLPGWSYCVISVARKCPRWKRIS